jgi:hypothetical protein
MPAGLHLAVAALLIAVHSLFLFRGLHLARRAAPPSTIDWLARLAAQIALVGTVITGILRLSGPSRPGAPLLLHAVCGLLPLLAIPLVSLLRLLTALRRTLPWLLPVLNLTLILLAFASGLLYTRW